MGKHKLTKRKRELLNLAFRHILLDIRIQTIKWLLDKDKRDLTPEIKAMSEEIEAYQKSKTQNISLPINQKNSNEPII